MKAMRSSMAFAAALFLAPGAFAQVWNGYGQGAQHTAMFSGKSQTVTQVHWFAALDSDQASNYVGNILTHYASVMLTPANTAIHVFRQTKTVNGATDYDNWQITARKTTNGSVLWNFATDYSAAVIFPNDWTSVYPASLCTKGGATQPNAVAFAGAAGSVFVRSNPDSATGTPSRFAFYTSAQDFNNNKSAYAPIKINTPLTADNSGNVYFGYEVEGSLPSNLTDLGSGGIVKLNITNGSAVYRSIGSLGLSYSVSQPAINSAPAVTSDGSTVYFALSGGDAVLAKFSTQSLTPVATVKLMDPSISGAEALLISESSASPMIGQDGHVFMGVFGNQWRESHGWMLQFDTNLVQTDSNGKRYPVGAFGWDDTPSTVPSNIVSSYHGRSSYLILCKYNNYDDNGGDPGADGSNKVAVIDPSSDSTTTDRQSGIPVMNEVVTVLSPNLSNDDPTHPNSRFEWCINSAAVDIAKKSAIINCEDGHLYRWSFVSNSITEALFLQPPTSEAYTSTAIGADGQIYAVNNALLFAVGDPFLASNVSLLQGTYLHGNKQSLQFKDGVTYAANSVNTSVGQSVAIEADFTLPTTSIHNLNVTATATSASGVTGFIYAWNYKTGGFVALNSVPLYTTATTFTGSTNSNGSQFLGPGGVVRILVRGIRPSHVSTNIFNFAADVINCSFN
jgi:hypothetical protein